MLKGLAYAKQYSSDILCFIKNLDWDTQRKSDSDVFGFVSAILITRVL
jgi:hypothetical protein